MARTSAPINEIAVWPALAQFWHPVAYAHEARPYGTRRLLSEGPVSVPARRNDGLERRSLSAEYEPLGVIAQPITIQSMCW